MPRGSSRSSRKKWLRRFLSAPQSPSSAGLAWSEDGEPLVGEDGPQARRGQPGALCWEMTVGDFPPEEPAGMKAGVGAVENPGVPLVGERRGSRGAGEASAPSAGLSREPVHGPGACAGHSTRFPGPRSTKGSWQSLRRPGGGPPGRCARPGDAGEAEWQETLQTPPLSYPQLALRGNPRPKGRRALAQGFRSNHCKLPTSLFLAWAPCLASCSQCLCPRPPSPVAWAFWPPTFLRPSICPSARCCPAAPHCPLLLPPLLPTLPPAPALCLCCRHPPTFV